MSELESSGSDQILDPPLDADELYHYLIDESLEIVATKGRSERVVRPRTRDEGTHYFEDDMGRWVAREAIENGINSPEWDVKLRSQNTGSDHDDDLRTDGGTPIHELAADDGLEPGVTPYGNCVHLVDFNSRSTLVRGTEDASDKLLCGAVGEYERCDPPESGSAWCGQCLDRLLGYRLELTERPEFVADGGRDSDHRLRESIKQLRLFVNESGGDLSRRDFEDCHVANEWLSAVAERLDIDVDELGDMEVPA